jgi:tripartite-type tricarboxylate transporter receptor subunit TctC
MFLKYIASFLLMATSCGVTQAHAQAYPGKPVRMVVGFGSGGGTDTLARVLSRKLPEIWSQPLVVENRPGADGSIATEIVAKSPADGYTLVMVSNAHTITPFQRKLAYDPVKDFAPITLIGSNPNLLLLHPTLPVKSLKELIALAQARPNELAFASSGAGTSPYLAMELLKSITGMKLTHVPYKGSGPAVIDLMGGHVQLMFGAVSTTLAHLQSGRLRAIAISSPQRWPALPEIPTVSESGVPGFEASTWYGVLAPAGTPPAIVSKLHTDMVAAITAADIRKHVLDLGISTIASTPREFADVIRNDMTRWGKLIRSLEQQK